MGQLKTMVIGEPEAWILDDLIRHTWSEEGRPVGKGLLLKIFSLIKEFEARSHKPHPPRELPLALTEEECWAIDFHVRRGYVDPAGFRVGKELLLKVFGILLEFANEEEMRRVAFVEGPTGEDDEQVRARLSALRHYLQSQRSDEPDRDPDADDSTEC